MQNSQPRQFGAPLTEYQCKNRQMFAPPDSQKDALKVRAYEYSQKENCSPHLYQSACNFKNAQDPKYLESLPSAQFLQIQQDFTKMQPDSLPIKFRQNYTVRKTEEDSPVPQIENLEEQMNNLNLVKNQVHFEQHVTPFFGTKESSTAKEKVQNYLFKKPTSMKCLNYENKTPVFFNPMIPENSDWEKEMKNQLEIESPCSENEVYEKSYQNKFQSSDTQNHCGISN